MTDTLSNSPPPEQDSELQRIVSEEADCLGRVMEHVRTRKISAGPRRIDYDRQLLDLRDQIAQARMEDVPPLLEQMERLQHLAARQGQTTVGHIDEQSPYFGRMVLRENEREREVLIGRSTYLDTKAGVRIVDWRDAPVSRLYYRYNEGDDYEETFGDREVEGEVVVRRSVTIADSTLKRISAPQGVFLGGKSGWKRGGPGTKLAGGQGSALRASHHHRPGKLGVGNEEAGEDRHLRAITALIDPRQFELITKPDSGLVVIQGGAGSGKTTIGLHRLAYLAFQDRRRFRPDRMLVIAFNQALVRYISQVLPALDVAGVGVRTFTEWANRLRTSHFPKLARRQAEDTPGVVTRFKKHPALLKVIDERAAALLDRIEARIQQALEGEPERAAEAKRTLRGGKPRPLAHRLHGLSRWSRSARLSGRSANALQAELRRGLAEAEDVVGAWAEFLTDRRAMQQAMDTHAPGEFTEQDIQRVHQWCTAKTALAIAELEQKQEAAQAAGKPKPKTKGRAASDDDARPPAAELFDRTSDLETEEEPAELDAEDDALLLRFYQRLRGPLLRPNGQDALSYEHILVDEAQDMSPVELAVLTQTVSGGQSMTLAGDVAQRLYMDNGFTGWDSLLGELGLSHVQVEPLQVTYRSTAEVMKVAQAVLGPLAEGPPPQATRQGAPVELFQFEHSGDAVGFLVEALRELASDEPQASIAVISRYPQQADVYHAGLHKAEIRNLRRIAEQDFPFKPGVDVTDIRQVKGLEFDYVILVDANTSSYPDEDEARHLLHIAATRAAHQLWLLSTGKPSRLLPDFLLPESES